MRSGWILLGYIGMVFTGGALLAPWLFWLAGILSGHFPAFQSLAGHPFHRYVNRGVLLLAFLGLWGLARRLGFNSWSAVGFARTGREGRDLFAGFGVGLGVLALVGGLQFAAGVRDWNDPRTAEELIRCLLRAGVAAAWVSVAEELVFRGLLFGGLRQSFRWPVALAVSSAFYSMVHFFARPPSPASVDWRSGLMTLGGMLRGWFDTGNLLPAAASLFLTGLVLGLAYQRTGNLFTSVGLHAGWVFGLKVYAYLTRGSDAADIHGWGTGRMLDGWVMFAVLGALWLVLTQYWRIPVRSKEGTAWQPDAEAG